MLNLATIWKRTLLRSGWLAVAGLSLALATGCSGTGTNTSVAQRDAWLFEEITDEDKKASDMHFAVARGLETQGNLIGAIDAYHKALERNKDRADIHQRLAVTYDRRGEHRKAQMHYQEALKLDPGNPEIFCDMGYSLYLQRKWDPSEQNFRQALAVNPNHARSHNNLGLVLAHTGRFGDALAEFHRGGCNEAECHMNIALAMAVDGNIGKAREHYKLALTANPSLQSAKEALAKLERVEKKVGDKMLAAQDRKPAVKQAVAKKTNPVRLPPVQSPVVQSPVSKALNQAQVAKSDEAASSVVQIPSTVPGESGLTQASAQSSSEVAEAGNAPSLEIAPGALRRDRYRDEAL